MMTEAVKGVSPPRAGIHGRCAAIETGCDAALRLRIGGVQKQSLIDYPGKLSCVLFLSGCNLACPYCHNPELARGKLPGGLAWDSRRVLEFLAQRRGFLDGVVISGGEPTLWEDLPSLCELVRGLGYPVKLDTNGTRPRMLQRLIEGRLVDFVAMDIKTNPFGYGVLGRSACDPTRILDSIGLIMNSAVDYEFRTTCVRPLVTGRAVAAIAGLIRGARCYALQSFRSARVLQPEYFQDGRRHEYSARAMARLQAIAAPSVARCVVR